MPGYDRVAAEPVVPEKVNGAQKAAAINKKTVI